MVISLLPLGKLNVAYEAYLSSLGISTRSFVLKGESMDIPDLSVLQNRGAFNSSRNVTIPAFRSASASRKQGPKQLQTLTPAEQETGQK